MRTVTESAAKAGVPNPRQVVEVARALAATHLEVTHDPARRRSVTPLLREAGETITEAYRTFAEATSEGLDLTAGAHWILDNLHLLREQQLEVSRHLRGRFLVELPHLTEGPYESFPRIYHVVAVLLDTLDNELGEDDLVGFLRAYQSVCPLSIGELWAVPDALRIGLFMNLQQLSGELRTAHRERRRAREWAERIREAADRDPIEGSWTAKQMLEERPSLSDAFVHALVERLQGDQGTAAVIEWLERRLASRATSLQDVARLATQRQVSVAHAVSTLRWTADASWVRIVEAVSIIEKLLRRDPAGVYGRMDPGTRDRYRHVVEDLARYSKHEETAVVELLLERCRAAEGAAGTEAGAGAPAEAGPSEAAPTATHVGHHLLGPGARAFEDELGTRPPLRRRFVRAVRYRPHLFYFGTIALVTVLSELAILAVARGGGVSFELLLVVMLTALLPVVDTAVAFTNRLVAWIVPPRRLPKMDRDRGLGRDHRTLVVVPTLLRSPEDARAQVQSLEIHARGNPSPLLRFALLADYQDADTQTRPGDAAIVEAARAEIARLNESEGDAWGDRYFLLHRERVWSEPEGVWMGPERKRGKIEDLNTLLRTPDARTSYSIFEGDFFGITADDAIRYVIALDADTRMPPDAAIDLVRTAAHPLNQPRFDPSGTRVVDGYGILQPRVSISPDSASRSPFARVFSGIVGLDPYTTAVSNTYQDLYDQGIFTGKGLYDVDAFFRALDGVVPHDTVLSHDLLEGTFARAALVTDVEVYDDYPKDFVAYAKRMHRWVRGDWQILGFLFPSYRAQDGSLRRNPISLLSRWQILDNVRRSLNEPAMLLFLLAGWIALPRAPLFWTGVALAILAFPVYVNLTAAVFSRPSDARLKSYFAGVGRDVRLNVVQTFLTIVFLAQTAMSELDAVVRVTWRMLVSRRHLLQWRSATDVERAAKSDLLEYVGYMWPSVAWALISLTLVVLIEPRGLTAAGPFIAAWLAAPWIAWYLGRPARTVREVLGAGDRAWLRRMARRTWSYFEDHIGPESSWLPPDNVQEYPYKGAATRTSPTNIGLALVSTHVARDFGWLGDDELLERLEASAASIDRLETHAGHLLNWYDTVEGRTLWPRYVSTVDSGNWVASLIAVRRALLEWETGRWPNPKLASGLRDSVRLLRDRIEEAADPVDGPGDPELVELAERLESLAADARSERLAAWLETLDRAGDVVSHPAPPAEPAPTPPASESNGNDVEKLGSASAAARRLVTFLERQRREMAELVPWWAAGEAVPDDVARARSLRTLRDVLTARAPEDSRAAEALAALEARDRKRAGLTEWCRRWIRGTAFSVVYDRRRDLFSVGRDLGAAGLDAAHYDLMASEARLTSFVAIALGQVPPKHWFRLSRPTAEVDDGSALLSWNGSMFEYLMPLLFLPAWPGTLLEESYHKAVTTQKRYGAALGRPWGMSESAYSVLNLSLDYQYRGFGVPELGLKRGLADDVVVAPYASALATMVLPATAVENLRRLEREGASGAYGFYDAVDYTPSRLPPGEDRTVVRNWMAHHQGMSLLAWANVLDDNRVQAAFRASSWVQAAELLIQERVPRHVETVDPLPLTPVVAVETSAPEAPPVTHVPARCLSGPCPTGGLLSNGRYSVLLTQAGTGRACYGDIELTRWRADRTCDPDGMFFYIRDLESGRVWSATPHPVRAGADRYDTWLHLSKIESALVYDWIETFVEVCVSPEDDVEVRRLTITNYGDATRRLDVTSYLEVVLDDAGADQAHPAFSKLFVETEVLSEGDALLATRRPREPEDQRPWMFHTVAGPAGRTSSANGEAPEPREYETDREAFIGRGRTLAEPRSLEPGATLSGTTGPVLDPILSLRRTIEVGPHKRVVLGFVVGVAPTRDDAVELAERYDNPTAVQRVIDLASAYGPVEAEHLALAPAEALELQRFGVGLLYGDPRLRAEPEVLARNRNQQSDLWRYGISGDRPLIVVRAASVDQMDEVRAAIRAFEYLRLKGIDPDLVFLNQHPPSYLEGLQDLMTQATQVSSGRASPFHKGRLHVLRADQLPPEDVDLLLTVARAVFSSGIRAPELSEGGPSRPVGRRRRRSVAVAGVAAAGAGLPPGSAPLSHVPLDADNGFGGFAPDGSYVIRGGEDGRPTPTPHPWVNVVANRKAGFVASEAGGGFTWSVNSRENRLSPWSNDPVVDRPSEVVYVRDEETGVWGSVTPRPAPLPGRFETRHDFGRTTYLHEGEGLEHELTLFMAEDDPVKLLRLRIRNAEPRARTLSVFHYHEWVLGVDREEAGRHVVTERDLRTGALLARNHYNREFADRTAFVQVLTAAADAIEVTGDRHAFLGAGRDVDDPAALMTPAGLEGRVGAGLDPCSAWRVALTLPPSGEATVVFVVGEAQDLAAARGLLAEYDTPRRADEALERSREAWARRLGGIEVETPSPAIDRVLNGWMMYQTLSCRVWGRSAFYQSGGAYGFRDQLQDSMALVYAEPDLAREQILLHAAHQFVEGDVLHWWHPPTGRGVRTRFSDDLLWLPYVTAFYVGSTGDRSILDEDVGYLTARPLEDEEQEAYLEPSLSPGQGDLYEHCCRAIDRSLTKGAHGLPLMGAGDWNDGMNRVGLGGGESVWLGFFLHTILEAFIPVCRSRGDGGRVERYETYRADLAAALDDAGWDGAWYRRAYYGDGTPLGSAQNMECRIDAIAQAWSVLSGVAPPDRARTAMDSLGEHLVDRERGLIRLLWPPFDDTPNDPGYIRGYVPGVRENGGQYTHGVLWAIQAFARLGDVDRARDLFEMISPLSHASTREAAQRYRVEPYVAVADIYSVPPHDGRGGWSWYTGSGPWMLRVALESILGFTLVGGDIRLSPSMPSGWSCYRITYRPSPGTEYRIEVSAADDGAGVTAAAGGEARRIVASLDGEPLPVQDGAVRIPVDDDGGRHVVGVRVPPP